MVCTRTAVGNLEACDVAVAAAEVTGSTDASWELCEELLVVVEASAELVCTSTEEPCSSRECKWADELSEVSTPAVNRQSDSTPPFRWLLL